MKYIPNQFTPHNFTGIKCWCHPLVLPISEDEFIVTHRGVEVDLAMPREMPVPVDGV